MGSRVARVIAVLDAISVRFVLVPAIYWASTRLFPQFEAWQTGPLGFPFPIFNQVLMALVPLAILVARRKDLAPYGLSFGRLGFQLGIAGTCFVPFVLASAPLGMGVDFTTWGGALVMAATQLALTVVVAWLLRRKPSGASLGVAGGWLVMATAWRSPAATAAGQVVATFLTYALFVGFGEEIIYRGYVQSRLNEAFGRPYQFLGTRFGWGLPIAALLFGLSHVGLVGYLLGETTELTWAWGLWTAFGGLAFGVVREKSGGVLASALLHGLPQALASAAMLFV
jgi:membrane protease YdiL (CAAX protease family)